VSGTGEPGATVTVYEGAEVVCTATVSSGGTWSCVPAQDLAIGPHDLTASQVVGSGPASARSDSVRVIVAPAPPAITGPADGATDVPGDTDIDGTGTPGATVTVRDGDDPVCTAVVGTDGRWSCTPGAPLPAGPHTLTATQTVNGVESAPTTARFSVLAALAQTGASARGQAGWAMVLVLIGVALLLGGRRPAARGRLRSARAARF
jgi:hypothetical protein